MNITTKEIKSEVESCRAAEADLAKLRLQKSELEAGETQAKASLTLSASGTSALDNQINQLSKQRAKIEGVTYEISVREQALANRHALLRNYGVTLIGEAKARYDRCRQTILTKLPETLRHPDAEAVVRWYFPKLDEKRVIQFGAISLLRIPYLTTVAHVRKRVDFLARRQPGKDESALLDAVLVEMEGEIMAALQAAKGAAVHGAGAARARDVQAPSRPVETVPDRGGSAPGVRLSSLRGQQSLVTA